ncbi:MAG: dihydrofolate reductase [Anaerolineales bacterium]|nr:dihydrofolate reductase [Anaerolineales bacterium]
MRKIVMLNRVSIDGYFASLNEKTWGMDWFVQDPKVDKAAHKVGDSDTPPDTLILGGTTYRGFERSWVPQLKDPKAPKQMKAVAEELTNMTKVVFSKTLKENDITWENTRLFNGNLAEEVRKLKQAKGAGIMIMGSGTIVQQLANEGLIDEYVFIVTPVVAGEGKPLFKEVKESKLELVETKAFKSGNILLHYKTGK